MKLKLFCQQAEEMQEMMDTWKERRTFEKYWNNET